MKACAQTLWNTINVRSLKSKLVETMNKHGCYSAEGLPWNQLILHCNTYFSWQMFNQWNFNKIYQNISKPITFPTCFFHSVGDGVSGNPITISLSWSRAITHGPYIHWIKFPGISKTYGFVTGFPETQSHFGLGFGYKNVIDFQIFSAEYKWPNAIGFLKTPWCPAKCIWRPMMSGQMHLATHDARPNAFGDPWCPAKCIWRPMMSGQMHLATHDVRPNAFGDPWWPAKCIWRPMMSGQMHLATHDVRPNAFGDPWCPAKCIRRPMMPGQKYLATHAILFSYYPNFDQSIPLEIRGGGLSALI